MKNKFINIISKLKKLVVLVLLLALFVFINAIGYVSAVSDSLSNSILRLHVVANSDSEEDQSLKYIVRDEIIKYINTKYAAKTKKELMSSIDLSAIKEIAQKTIFENGFSYNVTVQLGNFEFPTKSYGDISFPSGFYDALRIKIGNGEGKNWWCVMFPPLCFVDVSSGIVPESSKELLEQNLNHEEYSLISNATTTIKFKFKIVEFFQNLSMQIASISDN